MKIDISVPILGIDGEPMINSTGVNAVIKQTGEQLLLPYGTEVVTEAGKTVKLKDKTAPMTLADAFMTACTTPMEEDKGEDVKTALARMELAELFFKNQKGSVQLDDEQRVMIKDRVYKTYVSRTVYAGVCKILKAYEDK